MSFLLSRYPKVLILNNVVHYLVHVVTLFSFAKLREKEDGNDCVCIPICGPGELSSKEKLAKQFALSEIETEQFCHYMKHYRYSGPMIYERLESWHQRLVRTVFEITERPRSGGILLT